MRERTGHTQRERGEGERERLARNYETMNAPNCQPPTDTTKGKALRRSVVLPPW